MLEQNLDDVVATRALPPGRYAGNIISWKQSKTATGTEKASLAFRVKEALTDTDLSGVELNKFVYMDVWLTDNTKKRNKTMFVNANIDSDGKSYKEIFDSLESADVVFEVGADDWAQKNRDEYRPVVTKFKLA